MENAIPLRVPNKCDIDLGPSWGEAEEIKWGEDYGRQLFMVRPVVPRVFTRWIGPGISVVFICHFRIVFSCQMVWDYLRIAHMDTTRWKSILVPIEVYRQIREIAHLEGRTISGQLRLIFEQWKEDRKMEARRLDDVASGWKNVGVQFQPLDIPRNRQNLASLTPTRPRHSLILLSGALSFDQGLNNPFMRSFALYGS